MIVLEDGKDCMLTCEHEFAQNSTCSTVHTIVRRKPNFACGDPTVLGSLINHGDEQPKDDSSTYDD